MINEDDDNIIPNEDDSQQDSNDSNESIDEGFEDIKTSEGMHHFYENHESYRNVQRLVFGLCFLRNS